MVKVANKNDIVLERVQNHESRLVKIFMGDMKSNARVLEPETMPGMDVLVKMTNAKWVDSEAYHKLWNKIGKLKEAAKPELEKFFNQNSVPSNLSQLIQALFIDVTRRVMEEVDYTGMINIETTNFAYPEAVNVRELYKYRGKFEHYGMNNDPVALIEQNSGAAATITMEAKALGWKDTLKNLLFNSLFDMQKVLEAVADAYVYERNDNALGYIFGTVFAPSQVIPLVTLSGSPTYDEQLYAQFRAAYTVIRMLLDPQNGRPITIPSLAVICHPARVWEIQRVIQGMLERSGATTGRGNLTSALPIEEIWPYQGITYTWGKKTVTYAGCALDEAYLLVPRMYSYTAVKRPLTQEVGRGSVLQLSTEERAWYYVQTDYHRDLLGSSQPGTSLGEGYGAIVKITLPEPEIDT